MPRNLLNPLDLFEPLVHAGNEDQLKAAIQHVASQLGFDTYCFGMFNREQATDEVTHFSLDNYRPGWIEHYVSNDYLGIDVAVTHCLSHATPLVWTGDLYDTPQLRPLQEEALAYGIDGGVTLPIHSPWLSGCGGLILATGEQADRTAKRAGEFLGLAQLLACHISQAVRDLDLFPSVQALRKGETLSARELECLHWLACGLTAKGIAARMRISEATVSTHFKPSIRRKLGVASSKEAVALAIRHRLIMP